MEAEEIGVRWGSVEEAAGCPYLLLAVPVQSFPAVLVASALGFKHQEFYNIAEEDREVVSRAPEVKF